MTSKDVANKLTVSVSVLICKKDWNTCTFVSPSLNLKPGPAWNAILPSGWWFGTCFLNVSIYIYREQSSQLTFMFFKGVETI